MKKLITLLAAGCLLFTACGTTTTTTKENELSIFMMGSSGGQDFNVPVFQKAEELTGITLKNVASTVISDGTSAFSTMMASKDLPDIINYSASGREEFFTYGAQGAYIPLNALIEKDAPNIKSFLDSRPDVKKYITAPDGNIYFIPFVPDGQVSQSWYIRQDWLNKLGLEKPKTAKDFYKVLTAFRNSDPNGNGEKDEVPYFSRNVGPQYETGVSDLFPLWKATKDWYVDGDNVVHFGSYEAEYKTAVENVAKWYKEGLIDQEIYTRGGDSRNIMLSGNLGGCTHDWSGSNAAFNDTLKDTVPGFSFVPMAPPAGYEHMSRAFIAAGWAISGKSKKPQAAVKYFDFWYSEEGARLANFGVEGGQYDMVNGKPVFNDSVLKGDKAANLMLQEVGAQLTFGYPQNFDYEKQWLNPIAAAGIQEYIDNNYIKILFPDITRTEEEEKEYSEAFVNLQTYRDQMTQKWILGSSDVVADWDGYIKELENRGIKRLVEIQQAAYDRYNSVK